jgi:hypothetical protein
VKALFMVCGVITLAVNDGPIFVDSVFKGWPFVLWKIICLLAAWLSFSFAFSWKEVRL